MNIPWTYNLRSLLVRRTTTGAVALGIGMVVFVLASSLMLSKGISETLVSSGKLEDALVLRQGSDTELTSGIEQEVLNLIKAAPGVKRGADGQPLVIGDLVVVVALPKLGTGGQVSNVQVRGVEPGVTQVRRQVKVVAGRPPRPGTDEGMVGSGVAGRFAGLEVGKSFELRKNRPIEIVGVFQAEGSAFESEVWVDYNTLRSAFGREGLFSSVTAELDSPSKLEGFRASIEGDQRLGLEVQAERHYYEEQSSGTSIFVSTLGIVVVAFFSIGAALAALITMYGSVSQRTSEIGTLRALGFTRLSILIAFLGESVVLALSGAALGVAGAMGMSFVKLSMLNFQTWQEISFAFVATPSVLIAAVAVGAGIGIFGGFLPAVKAARISPIDAIRAA
jgi:putative ABC transport system permease protein